MLYFIGIVIAFFLASLLLGKKNKSIADKILAVWLVFIGLHLLVFYLHFTGKIYQMPWILGWEMPLPLVHGPFLYLYAAALMNRLPRNLKWILVHFIPVVLTMVYLIRFFTLGSAERVQVYLNEGSGFESFMTTRTIAIIISGLGYVTWTNLLLARHRAAIIHQFSSIEKINLKWLQYLSLGIAVIWLAVIFGGEELTFTSVVLFVIFMGYFGIRQVGIFAPRAILDGAPLSQGSFFIEDDPEPPEAVIRKDAGNERIFNRNLQPSLAPSTIETENEQSEKKKYSKSGLSPEMAQNLHRELSQMMEREKLFSESELSLAALAKKLNVHPNYLSQVINEIEGKNFYDYINSLRIEEFKRLVAMPSNQQYTILSMAYECGFNSKSSFNRFFKKATGVSPSEYLREHAVEVAG